jgi:hypothetical protein
VTTCLAINHALNDYDAAEGDATGYVAGKRVANRKARKRAALNILWTYRNQIRQLIRDANP